MSSDIEHGVARSDGMLEVFYILPFPQKRINGVWKVTVIEGRSNRWNYASFRDTMSACRFYDTESDIATMLKETMHVHMLE